MKENSNTYNSTNNKSFYKKQKQKITEISDLLFCKLSEFLLL